MRKAVFFVFFLYSVVTISQEKYRINVDYNSGNLIYLELDQHNKIIDTLKHPKFKKNSVIGIHLKNINPFALKVVTQVDKEIYHNSSQGYNISNFLGEFINVANGVNSNFSKLSGGTKMGDYAKFRGDDKNKEVKKIFEDINEISLNIEALKLTLITNLTNPNLTKEEIKKSIITIIESSDDLRLPSNPGDNFQKVMVTYENLIKSNKIELETFLEDFNYLQTKRLSGEEKLVRGEIIESQIFILDIQKTSENLENNTNLVIKNIKDLQKLYSLLESSSFERSFDYIIDADKVAIKFDFIPININNEGQEEAKPTKSKSVQLITRGGIKINTSLALTLNNFGKNSYDYSLKSDGSIVADQNNFFIPNISTLINFYPLISQSLNFGGSFGFSIPFNGAIEGINFLAGPTIIFGDNNRVSFSGGIAYGPVKKLKYGLEVGDIISSGTIDASTKTVYDLGYYLGFSFNLFDLSKK